MRSTVIVSDRSVARLEVIERAVAGSIARQTRGPTILFIRPNKNGRRVCVTWPAPLPRKVNTYKIHLSKEVIFRNVCLECLVIWERELDNWYIREVPTRSSKTWIWRTETRTS